MEETKRCPYCGEEILAVAKKCKHCGEWLETKETRKEMKACPICGEMIDEDLDICPYCHESTHFKDVQTTSTLYQQENVEVDDSQYLYCKSCKAKLHMDSESCNNCGDNDPFYFKKIKRFETISSWTAAALILGVLYFLSEYAGFRLNIAPAWLGFICFMVIYLILVGIITVLIRWLLFQSYIKDYEAVMQRLFDDVGYPTAINNWKAKVDKIL